MLRVTYTHKNQRHSLNRWFTARRRCFIYHYDIDDEMRPEIEWTNLHTLKGCKYHGWIELLPNIRGEMWSYQTKHTRLLVHMTVPPTHLLFSEAYRKVQKEIRGMQKKIRSTFKHPLYKKPNSKKKVIK